MKLNIPAAICAIVFLALGAAGQALEREKAIAGAERAWDKFVKAYVAPGPGCSAAVSIGGETVFAKAFGLAEIEHNVPNTPDTIFESGSVAKQFTAAALVLLQQDGKLNLDEPVRKYIPELPDYGTPLTIRHMLNHTSGLRDWGSVMALTGVGRGDRVVTQDVALDVMARQKELNFKPGTEYSYSNSGYNLAAIIVERVSKQKFSDFVAERIFKPLGMTKSSWRDDFQRIVPGRALGYAREGANAPWKNNMPFMNVIGNGGMLTTARDWMKWNTMLDSRSMGAPLVDALETQGILNDGRKIAYALGLVINNYKGFRDISHSGGTAGYQTYLVRYPEKKFSVGVLCNGSVPSAGAVAASITDEILGPFPEGPKPAEPVSVPEDELKKLVGIWRNDKTHEPARTAVDKGVLRFGNTPLRPLGNGSFMLRDIRLNFIFDKAGQPVAIQGVETDGGGDRFTFEKAWVPTADELKAMAGEWSSAEAQATVTFAVEGDKVSIVNLPLILLPLQPLYKDHFSGGGQIVWFTRDKAGKIDRMHVGASRMRDMSFERVKR